MTATETFAKRFKDLRIQKGESLQKIAQDLNVTAQSLSLYEKGQRTINIDLLQKIANHFNVSADYLLGFTENATTDPELQNACKFTGLSEKALLNLHSLLSVESGEKLLKNVSFLLSDIEFVCLLELISKYSDIMHSRKNLSGMSLKQGMGALNYLSSKDLLTTEEQAEKEALILLEKYGYKVLTNKKDISDFYLQKITSKIFDCFYRDVVNEGNMWEY